MRGEQLPECRIEHHHFDESRENDEVRIVLTANVQPNLDVNYTGMDVHSGNVVVCVRRNTINSSGQLVGKTIKTKRVVIKNSQEPLVELLSKYADGQQYIMTAESTFNW